MINESRSWFFEKINKIDKLLTKLIKKKKKRTQIKSEKRKSNNQYQRNTNNLRNYYEQLYAKKLDSLGETDKFLETYNLPKLNLEESENLIK